eukprot:Selendium_serpulae@DN2927_c0_g1_i1.p2
MKQWLLNNDDLRDRCKYFWSDESRDDILYALARDTPRSENPLKDEGNSDDEDALKRGVRRNKVTDSYCVEWLGPLNKKNRYAAVRVALPATYDPWVTYANRVVVYMFGQIPNYQNPDSFHGQTSALPGEPFEMRCDNPKCIRLCHINYNLPDNDDNQEQDTDSQGSSGHYDDQSSFRRRRGSYRP